MVTTTQPKPRLLSLIRGSKTNAKANSAEVVDRDLLKVSLSPMTSVTQAHRDNRDPKEVDWGRSKLVQFRIERKPRLEKRFLIRRDSPIDGGVYYGAGPGREGIVVDWNKDEILRDLYKKILDNSIVNGVFLKTNFIANVYGTVRVTFSNSSEFQVDRLIEAHKLGDDRKVILGLFIGSGTGVCRHMALTCAALMERAVKDGYLEGKASVDRNGISGVGAHAWCRYTNSGGTPIIMDAMHDVFKILADTKNSSNWQYSRPEDLSRVKRILSYLRGLFR